MQQLPDINLETLPDPASRALVTQLVNLVETLHAQVGRLRTENQALHDELARLKGGSPKPPSPSAPAPATRDLSSERDRPAPQPRPRGSKCQRLGPIETRPCRLDLVTLPPGAIGSSTRWSCPDFMGQVQR